MNIPGGKLSEIQRHNKADQLNVEVYIGEDVYVKSDKSKLRGRETYKITQLFFKKGETWATIKKITPNSWQNSMMLKLQKYFL